jgi:hypothetical protein
LIGVLSPDQNVVQVAELLSQQLYTLGDKLLEQKTPIALTINDLHCITKRLRLPMDLQYNNTVSADLGHLYSFIHQIHSLKVILPPPPSSVTKMSFEMTPFRSLIILKIHSVPLSQISEMVRVQQQLQKLSAHNCIKSLRELLIDSVEEKRPQGAQTSQVVQTWRLVATAKFTTNRIIVQPWLSLTHLNISYNKLKYLDDSLQVLPSVKVLNISNNLLDNVDLQHLCLPSLLELNLSHNKITNIISKQIVLESIQVLDLSNNLLSELSSMVSFLTIKSLNISNNIVCSCDDFNHLSQLKSLSTLTIKNNPIMNNGTARIILLARFMHKSRMVSVDGMEATNKEQAKIRNLTEKYGSNVSDWPLAKQTLPTPIPEASPKATPTSPPILQVSWSVESVQPIATRSPGDSPTSASIDHPLFFDSSLSFKTSSSLPSSRDEPDGRSDISVQSANASPLVLATPPATPLSISVNESTVRQPVTPSMISAALEAVTQAASNSHASSPNGSMEHLSGILSRAIHNFISEQSSSVTTPPPSTPTNEEEDYRPENSSISATDLISALSAVVSAHVDGSTPAVPVGTPQEGLSELAKLGIQPEAILDALHALSSQVSKLDDEESDDDNNDDDELVRTITRDESDTSISDSPSTFSSSSDPIQRKKYKRIIDISLPIL